MAKQLNKRRGAYFLKVPLGRQQGFSIFELVVFIIIIAIIYATAANRFSEFPEAAEKGNFQAVTMQIQAGVSMQLLADLTAGRGQNLRHYDGSNPMDLLLEAPSNYLGSFDIVDTSRLSRRSWYFDKPVGELVYLVNASDNVFFLVDGVTIPTDEIRFKVVVQYLYENRVTGLPATNEQLQEISRSVINISGVSASAEFRQRFSGVLMRPVIPFIWGASNISLSETIVSETVS